MTELFDYFDRVRERTMRVARCIPPEKFDWTYAPGKFTLGDLMRHLAAVERWTFGENARLKASSYRGHGAELAPSYAEALEYMQRMHDESMAILRSLSEEQLEARCETPGGARITVAKWLRSMIEHEIHH